jgi:hypothetical protein
MSFACAHPARITAVFALAVLAAACGSDSPTQQTEPLDFEGTYSLLGTYTGRPGNSVEGSLVVSAQTATSATAAITVKITDNGITSFVLNFTDPDLEASADPGSAVIGDDGSFSITYSGPEVISGLDPADCCNFTFTLQGTLSGDRISGTWTLTRDMPSLDSGTFQATR